MVSPAPAMKRYLHLQQVMHFVSFKKCAHKLNPGYWVSALFISVLESGS